MKQGKKPTANQKKWLSSLDIDPTEYHVMQWGPHEVKLQNVKTKEIKTILLTK